MRSFHHHRGIVVPLDRANVDTDFIIPKQFLKSVRRTGFGVNLFDEHRYLDRGEPDSDHGARPLNPDFVLNQPRYRDGSILLARDNFGCGSSREHAPWALDDYGFRVLIAPSFADIFFNNCFKNGLLPIVLARATVAELFTAVAAREGFALSVALAEQTITLPDGATLPFDIEPFRKNCLLEGVDDIDLTLRDADRIRAYEARARVDTPWNFSGGDVRA